MDFGKLQDISDVDFTLPPDHPDTGPLLARLKTHRLGLPPEQREKARFYFAAPVWNDREFVGRIYPRGVKPQDYLREYARVFNSVELNSTYYGVNPEHIKKWKEAVSPEFRFSPKVPGLISHEKQLRNVTDDMQRFTEAVSAFGENLGPLFLLLPPSFGPPQIKFLEKFLGDFTSAKDAGMRIAIEVRNLDWFSNKRAQKHLFDLLESHGAISIITDTAGRRDAVHQRPTSSAAMIRFLGNRHDPSDFTRLDDWAERIKNWYARGLRTIYFFIHQPTEHLIIELAEHLVTRINAVCGSEIPVPRPVPPEPVQQELF